MKTLYEWRCHRCGFQGWFGRKPPKAYAMLYSAYMCPHCKKPMKEGTGQVWKRPSVRELL